jgi:hypothetical protein
MPLRFAALLLPLLAARLGAQAPDTLWQPIVPAGVLRASAAVDSVFIDRVSPSTTVAGGDFAAYLIARLGAPGLPPDFGYRVRVDSTQLRIGGRIDDLPAEARRALAQLLFLLPGATRLEARVTLSPAGPEAARFHLAGATVQGVPVPEAVLQPLMQSVARQYHVLGESGRDLLVQIPAGARVALVQGGVRLIAP